MKHRVFQADQRIAHAFDPVEIAPDQNENKCTDHAKCMEAAGLGADVQKHVQLFKQGTEQIRNRDQNPNDEKSNRGTLIRFIF